MYVCICTCIHINTYLKLTEPPGPPRKVEIEGLTKSSCTIKWKAPASDGGSPIMGYYVERRQSRGDIWLKVNRAAVKQTSLDVRDLIELNEYEFRVCAENEAGVGLPSENTCTVLVKDPFSKPGAPLNIKLSDISQGKMQLSWQPPKDNGGADITNYVIEVKSSNDLGWNPVNISEKVIKTSYEIKTLKEGVAYEFRVSAENKVGRGPPSETTKSFKYGKVLYITVAPHSIS